MSQNKGVDITRKRVAVSARDSELQAPCKLLKEYMTNDGNTMLHNAIEQNNKALVKKLLHSCTEVDARNESGATPLHLAAATGNDDFIHLLLKKRAKSDVMDNENRTFLDVVRTRAAILERNRIVLNSESGKLNLLLYLIQ